MISWQYCAERKDSQEVVGGTAGDVRLSSARGGIKLQAAITQTQSQVTFFRYGCGNGKLSSATVNLQGVLQGIIQLHDSRLITAAVTVVGRAENCYHIAIVTPIVTLRDSSIKDISVTCCFFIHIASKNAKSDGSQSTHTSITSW